MWAGYSPVALSPVRAPLEQLYSLTPLSQTQQLPPFIPLRTVRITNCPSPNDPQFVNNMVIGQQIAVAPRNGNFSMPSVILHPSASVAFSRPLELVQPPTSNILFQPYGQELVSFPTALRPSLDNSIVAVDGSSPLIISPQQVVLHTTSCNVSLPAFSSLACVPTCGNAPGFRNPFPIEQPLSGSSSGFFPVYQNSVSADCACIEAPVPDSIMADDESNNQQCSALENYQAPEFSSDAISDHLINISLSPRSDSPESSSSHVPLYERTGVQSPVLIAPISTSTSASDVVDVTGSVFDSEEEAFSLSRLINGQVPSESLETSHPPNAAVKSSPMRAHTSPLYSMVNDVSDLKKAAREQGAKQLITISIEDCSQPDDTVLQDTGDKGNATSLGGLYFCGVPCADLHAEKSFTLKENMEKVVIDMIASGLKFAVLAIRDEENLLQNSSRTVKDMEDVRQHW